MTMDKIDEILNFIKQTSQSCCGLSHGKNIIRKSDTKDKEKLKVLRELMPKYKEYLEGQLKISGWTETGIKKRVKLLNEYYKFFDTSQCANKFTSQSKLRSSILEEFMFLLFDDYIQFIKKKYQDKDDKIKSGATKAYTNLYFTGSSIREFIESPQLGINVKDQDFAIYRDIALNIENKQENIKIPIVAIENKTYTDKTMLEGIIATAEKIKNGNPYSMYIVATECYDVDTNVDPIYSRIDQIYVLRKCKRKEYDGQNNPIDPEVVIRLFNDVRQHIERPWSNIETKLRNDGALL